MPFKFILSDTETCRFFLVLFCFIKVEVLIKSWVGMKLFTENKMLTKYYKNQRNSNKENYIAWSKIKA